MKILLMTSNFAPRGTSHAVRTVHLAKYLARAGCEVDILTYTAETQLLFSPPDESLMAKAPAAEHVHRIGPGWIHRATTRAKERGADTRKLRTSGSRSALSQIFVPDPHVGAYRAFRREALHLLEGESDSVLITFAYPFTFTLLGADLKRRIDGLTWIADYGDPWTGSPVTELNLSGWRKWLDAKLESRALCVADAITVTTDPTADLYRRLFPDLADRVHVVTMGYDPDDAREIPARERTDAERDQVVLLHAGRLYAEARDPKPFLEAVENGLAAEPEKFSRLRIVLLGEVEDTIVAAIEGSPARGLFELKGWVTVEESVAWMKSADHLLLFGNQGAMQIPGKVFQYFGTGRPVFMICETEQDPTLDVIDRYGRAVVASNRADKIQTALAAALEQPGFDDSTGPGCEEFAWPTLAQRLVEIAESARADRRGANGSYA